MASFLIKRSRNHLTNAGIIPFILMFTSCFSLLYPLSLLQAQEAELTEETVLTMGSWRTDDIVQMRHILDVFEKQAPGIRIIFDPTPAPEYDEVLEAQLNSGSAPDIFYLRSFNVSRRLFEQGYLDTLNDLPGLKENFSTEMLTPWSSKQHSLYGVPFIAVAQGIYYNKQIFSRLNLTPPRTWEALIDQARIIKNAGIIPFANASGDEWTINEIVFFNLVPNFIGGYKGRMAYLTGESCFNDDKMIAAFQALADLIPFLPPNHTLLKYIDSLYMFIQGQAAMWMGGSWDIPFLESESPRFEWDVFAPPAPQNALRFMTFHLDAGVGLNRNSENKTAARTFLSWLTRPETGRLLANTLPGFFPMHRLQHLSPREKASLRAKQPEKFLENPHANTFLALRNQYPTDIRLAWEKLREGSPDGYELMKVASVHVINGDWAAKQAANFVQDGLATWFKPSMTCKKQ